MKWGWEAESWWIVYRCHRVSRAREEGGVRWTPGQRSGDRIEIDGQNDELQIDGKH